MSYIKHINTKHSIFNGLITLMVIFVFSILLSSSTHAITPTLSLELSGNSIAMDIVALDTTGTFASSNNLSISASTNNYSGYTLSISSSTNNAVLTGPLNTVSGTNEVLNSIGTISGVTSSGISQNDYSSSSNTQYNDTWGYKPSKINSVSNTNFLPAPSTSGDIIEATSAANTNNVANDYTVSIGARVTPATEIGAYSNTFVVTAVANLISYSITYNANDGNSGQDTTNMPSLNPQTDNVDTTTTTVTLSNNTPARDGYDFMGWCTAQVADGAACSGTEYQPGDSYTIDYIASNSFTLYARWELNACFGLESDLRCKVVAEWVAGGSRVQTNDTNTSTGIQAAITAANSGVFKYNSAVFGADSDATKQDGTKDDIYFFRGILDQTTGTYGSDGDGAAWPNYVVLSSASDSSGLTSSDTCWRIVRTTASGGVKMIYNGVWTGSTCANATTDAQVATSSFNSDYASNGYVSIDTQNIHAVGYTYNNSSTVTGVTTASSNTTIAKIFGSNSDYSVNGSDSVIKQYLEKTWFSNVSDYEDIMESSAGYCNDRTVVSFPSNYVGSSFTVLSESTQIAPYRAKYEDPYYYFAPRGRNAWLAQPPTLNCPRNIVDLYSTTTGTGNGQLDHPVALLTADEVNLVGSGYGSYTNFASNTNSYLNSGSDYWLLSPESNGSSYCEVSTFSVKDTGVLYPNYHTFASLGVRPVISLIEGTEVVSGTGTAANPWIVNPPKTIVNASSMQEVEACPSSITEGQVYSLTDSRDGHSYRVARLKDGNCWMLDNLAIDLTAVDIDMLKGNTNASDISLEFLKGVRTWSSGDGVYYARSAISKNSVGAGSYYDPENEVSGDCLNGWCVNSPSSGEWTSDAITPVTLYDSTSYAQGKVGVLYNYCAASAGSFCYYILDDKPDTLIDVSEDICPKGWRLPTGSASGEYMNLYNQYSGSSPSQIAAFQTALSTNYSGSYHTGTATNQGYAGYFWTSTKYENWDNAVNGLLVKSNSVDAAMYAYLNDWQSVRCILDN